MSIDEELLSASKELSEKMDQLSFSEPISHVYNPLNYGWKAHSLYICSYAKEVKQVLFWGMNPGPFGMVQTSVPFGEINAVRNWMKIQAPIGKPKLEHPKRPIEGFECKRSEVSGRRLWGLFSQRYPDPDDFFSKHFVANYCPLAFMEESGRNRTPDKLPKAELDCLFSACDIHLKKVVEILEPKWVIGVGKFAFQRIQAVIKNQAVKTGTILHPSPASPAANKDWAGMVTNQLQSLGVWKPTLLKV